MTVNQQRLRVTHKIATFKSRIPFNASSRLSTPCQTHRGLENATHWRQSVGGFVCGDKTDEENKILPPIIPFTLQPSSPFGALPIINRSAGQQMEAHKRSRGTTRKGAKLNWPPSPGFLFSRKFNYYRPLASECLCEHCLHFSRELRHLRAM